MIDHPIDPEDDLEKVDEEEWTAEDQARFEVDEAAWKEAIEAWNTDHHGPPEVRARKNARYVRRLVWRNSEAVVREILKFLSHLKDPQVAADLADYDLETVPLGEIIEPFAFGGVELYINQTDRSAYSVRLDLFFPGFLCGGGIRATLVRQQSGVFEMQDDYEISLS